MWGGRGATALALALEDSSSKRPGGQSLSTVCRCGCGHKHAGERSLEWQGEDLLGYFADILAYV